MVMSILKEKNQAKFQSNKNGSLLIKAKIGDSLQ